MADGPGRSAVEPTALQQGRISDPQDPNHEESGGAGESGDPPRLSCADVILRGPHVRNLKSGRKLRKVSRYPSTTEPRIWRAITIRWISLVPSPISHTLSSRIIRSTGYSAVYPYPPKIWTALVVVRIASSEQ